MGVYDMVERQQIKMTPDPSMHNYILGDEIDIPDGCYLTYEGAFIVTKGKIVGVAESIYDKWGSPLELRNILDPSNPVVVAMKEVEAKFK